MAKLLQDLGIMDFGRIQVGVFEIDGEPWFCEQDRTTGEVRGIGRSPTDKSQWTWRIMQETCFGR